VRVQHRDKRAALFSVIDEVQHVTRISPQPVQAGDQQFVAGSQKLDNGIKLDAACAAAPDSFSDRIISQPLFCNLARCISKSWSAELTRA